MGDGFLLIRLVNLSRSEKLNNTRGLKVSFLIIRIIVAIMLLFALAKLPYSYYTILRLVVCGTAFWSMFISIKLDKRTWCLVFGVIAVLFNPIFPIRLSRGIWQPIDIICALCFIISFLTIKSKKIY